MSLHLTISTGQGWPFSSDHRPPPPAPNFLPPLSLRHGTVSRWLSSSLNLLLNTSQGKKKCMYGFLTQILRQAVLDSPLTLFVKVWLNIKDDVLLCINPLSPGWIPLVKWRELLFKLSFYKRHIKSFLLKLTGLPTQARREKLCPWKLSWVLVQNSHDAEFGKRSQQTLFCCFQRFTFFQGLNLGCKERERLKVFVHISKSQFPLLSLKGLAQRCLSKFPSGSSCLSMST